MWRLSASRQPCSAGSCIVVTRNLLSGLKTTPRCEPAYGRGHLERFFLGLAAADKGALADGPCDRPVRMKRDIVDPAPFRVGRELRDVALDIERDQLAVVAAHHDALAVGSGAQDAAAVDDDRRNLAASAQPENAFLGADESRVVAEKMHRRDRRADFNRAYPVGDRNDGCRVIARIELFDHVMIQRSKPSRMVCSGNSRPMKMRRLSRGSPAFQARW